MATRIQTGGDGLYAISAALKDEREDADRNDRNFFVLTCSTRLWQLEIKGMNKASYMTTLGVRMFKNTSTLQQNTEALV